MEEAGSFIKEGSWCRLHGEGILEQRQEVGKELAECLSMGRAS